MRHFDRRDLRWRDDGDGLALCRGRTVLLHVVPDDRFPGMWRIRHHDGRRSDMVNITRAKDAAISIALAALNIQDRPVAAPPAGSREVPATPVAPDSIHAAGGLVSGPRPDREAA